MVEVTVRRVEDTFVKFFVYLLLIFTGKWTTKCLFFQGHISNKLFESQSQASTVC